MHKKKKESRSINPDDVSNLRPTNRAESTSRLFAFPGAIVTHATVSTRVEHAVHGALVTDRAFRSNVISGALLASTARHGFADFARRGAALRGAGLTAAGRRRGSGLIKPQINVLGESVAFVLHFVLSQAHGRVERSGRSTAGGRGGGVYGSSGVG